MANKDNKNVKAQKASAFIPVAPSTVPNIVTGSVETKSPLTALVATGRRLRANRGQLRSALIILIIVVIVVGLILLLVVVPAKQQARKAKQAEAITLMETNLADDAFTRNDIKLAVYHAKRALQASPKDLAAVQLVAALTSRTNPAESMKYYAQELILYKEQNNFSGQKPNTIQNWAAAGLADNAGSRVEALKYYKLVVQGGNPNNNDEKDLIRQSNEAIKRLQ